MIFDLLLPIQLSLKVLSKPPLTLLPIGGLKEKLLAAHRAGINKVLIPIENKKDLVEVPKTVLDSVEVLTVKNVDEVLKVALTKPLKRVEWVEVDQISKKEKIKEELSTH